MVMRNDIRLVSNFNLKMITKFINKHGYIMYQKFLPKISKGDKEFSLLMEK